MFGVSSASGRMRWRYGSADGSSYTEFMRYFGNWQNNYTSTSNALWNLSTTYGSFEFPSTVPSNTSDVTYRSFPFGSWQNTNTTVTWQCGTGSKITTTTSTAYTYYIPGQFIAFNVGSTAATFNSGSSGTTATIDGTLSGQTFDGDTSNTTTTYYSNTRVRVTDNGVSFNAVVGLLYNGTSYILKLSKNSTTAAFGANATIQVLDNFCAVFRIAGTSVLT
jgi:hypothetical protein